MVLYFSVDNGTRKFPPILTIYTCDPNSHLLLILTLEMQMVADNEAYEVEVTILELPQEGDLRRSP